MGGRQSLADVDAKQSVLAQGNVELEEEWLAKVKQRPPEDPWGDVLTGSPPHLQLAHIYAGVPEHPGT